MAWEQVNRVLHLSFKHHKDQEKQRAGKSQYDDIVLTFDSPESGDTVSPIGFVGKGTVNVQNPTIIASVGGMALNVTATWDPVAKVTNWQTDPVNLQPGGQYTLLITVSDAATLTGGGGSVSFYTSP